MCFCPSLSEDFLQLKAEIEAFPRRSGYYIIGLAELKTSVAATLSVSQVLERVFRHYDPESNDWPPGAHAWEDYQCSRVHAINHLEDALVGGHSIGHSQSTIAPTQAKEFVHRFETQFRPDVSYYTKLALGDPDYLFQHGIAVRTRQRLGLFCIVEND